MLVVSLAKISGSTSRLNSYGDSPHGSPGLWLKSGCRPKAKLALAMKPVYYLGWSAYRLLFATYFRWRVHHPERVPRHGPVILASNHASFLDPPLVGAGLTREINYLARESLFRFPIVGWVLRHW